jgi:hypothetical protein
MSLNERINVILYRHADKGLEILMHQTGDNQAYLPTLNTSETALENWLDNASPNASENTIQVQGGQVIAVEMDERHYKNGVGEDHPWKERLEIILTSQSSSKFIAFKELFRSVLPNEYALLKEFKDVLLDRNSVRDL